MAKISKREVVKLAIEWRKPPYVPWSFSFTQEAAEKLNKFYKTDNLDEVLENHILWLGDVIGFFENMGDDNYKDVFGVVWDRSEDKDIGIVKNCVLSEPDISGLVLPDPCDKRFFEDIPESLKKHGDRFRIYAIGFSLFERAWTLRGMENLLMDFYENPDFVRKLLRKIADYNIEEIKKALTFDIDAVHFGDDWGQQHGLIMGPALWREFILPELRRTYKVVKDAGKYVSIHSCGDVDELFDDLVDIGLNSFNPFQPEVMDTSSLFEKYRGRLAFFGGLSTQKILPYGSPEDVRRESSRLLSMGANGGYIFAPAHAVEGDVPLENMLAFIDAARNQPGVNK